MPPEITPAPHPEAIVVHDRRRFATNTRDLLEPRWLERDTLLGLALDADRAGYPEVLWAGYSWTETHHPPAPPDWLLVVELVAGPAGPIW